MLRTGTFQEFWLNCSVTSKEKLSKSLAIIKLGVQSKLCESSRAKQIFSQGILGKDALFIALNLEGLIWSLNLNSSLELKKLEFELEKA